MAVRGEKGNRPKFETALRKTGSVHEERRVAGMFGIGVEGLRNILVNPLRSRRLAARANEVGHAGPRSFNEATSQDPINAIIEGDIIPRLLVAQIEANRAEAATDHEGGKGHEPATLDHDAKARFAELPLRLEAPDLMSEIDRFLQAGVSIESILLDLLAPAARRLGEMWEDDEADFVDVTMGLWRLQEVMREVSLRSPPVKAAISGRLRALFSPVPGDTHSFGAQMLDEFFSRAGWQSDCLFQPERRELLDYLATQPIDIVGLTVSSDTQSGGVAGLMKAMRSVAKNPNLLIIVGGSAIARNPEIVAEVGADGTGADAREALSLAERLVEETRERAHIMK